MPPKKITFRRQRTSAEMRKEAFARLAEKYACPNGIEEAEEPDLAEDCKGEPVVTQILSQAEGGIPTILDALRSSSDDDAQSFIEMYDSLSATDKKYLTLEQIAVACGIGSRRLLEVATSASLDYGQTATKLLLASSMHKVVHAAVKSATTGQPVVDSDNQPFLDKKGNPIMMGHGDVRAMELVGKMTGIVPVPKGAQVLIQNVQAAPEKEEESRPGWMDADQRLKAIHDVVEAKRLPSPPSDPLQIGGRLDHMQAEVVEMIRKDV